MLYSAILNLTTEYCKDGQLSVPSRAKPNGQKGESPQQYRREVFLSSDMATVFVEEYLEYHAVAGPGEEGEEGNPIYLKIRYGRIEGLLQLFCRAL